MHTRSIEPWLHDHTFGQEEPKAGERRTLIVIVITAVTMVVEIAAGLLYGSMALLADGLHMASHAAALMIAACAYFYARKHASDKRFNFGTGKVNSLAGFASGVLLVVFAFFMAFTSAKRFIFPVHIEFNYAIIVACIGLIVNFVSMVILRGRKQVHDRHDHNLWSAYLHVLADALTSLLAIVALVSAKYLGWVWLDPLMGIVGAVLVGRWCLMLLRSAGATLLDVRPPEMVTTKIKRVIESDADNRISDMHVWSVGPGIYAAELAVVTAKPQHLNHYYDLLPADIGLVHMTVEIHKCDGHNEIS